MMTATFPRQRLMLLCFGVMLLICLINPVGFLGGGQDDGRYLQAAGCWARNGACLPHNHWAGRWPVFAPLAPLLHWFAPSRAIVQIWPLIASTAALCLFAVLALQLFGSRTATIAVLLLAFSSAFALQAMTPSVESLELCAMFVAALCVWKLARGGHVLWALVAGLAVGLGFQVRETALFAGAIVAIGAITAGLRPKGTEVFLAIVGFLLPLAIEFLVYANLTGDPLFRRRLSLAHTTIPSSELSSAVDNSGSPLFNPDVIAGWRREPGLRVHWAIDGPLNLLFNGKSGFSLLLAPLFLLFGNRFLGPAARKAALGLLGLAALYIVAVTYVLSMDPKPRVMLPAIAFSSGALALILTGLIARGKRAIAFATLGAVCAAGAMTLYTYLRPVLGDRSAEAWIARYPGDVESDPNSKATLMLSPARSKLAPLESDRRYLLIVSSRRCDLWRNQAGLSQDDLAIERQQPLTRVVIDPDNSAWSCLFRYQRQMTPTEVKKAVSRGWDRPFKIN